MSGQAPVYRIRNNMKNRTLFSAAVLGSLLLIGILYFISSDVALTLNKSFEMLNTGNAKGLRMLYYKFGSGAYMMAIIVSAIQFLVPAFPKDPVILAGTAYFGDSAGILSVVAGASLAAAYVYAIGRAVSYILRFGKKTETLDKYMPPLAFVFQLMPKGLPSLIGYAAGFLSADFKKFMFSVIAGQVVYCILKIWLL